MVRRGSEPELGFHILDIPHHILFDIMLKLPAVTLIRCSSVCSRFKSIVSDTSFQQSYFSKAPNSFVVLSDHNSLTCIDSSATQIQSVPNSYHGSSCMAMQLQPSYSSDSKRSKNNNTTTTTTTVAGTVAPIRIAQQRSVNRRTRFVTFNINRRMNLINSSNGLLCLRASNYHSRSLYYVCNPLLGEVLPVPPALSAADENLRFSAFGFDPKKKNFKIIQLVSKSEQMVAEMYQSDSRASTWTVIPNAPSAKPKSKNCSFDPSFNGALHWVTEDTNSELICSFDLDSNTFGSVPPPLHFDQEYVSKISGISVGVLKGCLCLCYVIEGAKFETWLMEDYGVKESWRKAFSIDIKSYCGLSPQDKHRPIGFNNCGDMWLRADSDSHSHSQCLVSFCPETGVFRHIDIGGVAANVQATPQVFSYVSIKQMVDIRHRQLQLQSLKPGKNYHPIGFNMLLMGNFR